MSGAAIKAEVYFSAGVACMGINALFSTVPEADRPNLPDMIELDDTALYLLILEDGRVVVGSAQIPDDADPVPAFAPIREAARADALRKLADLPPPIRA